MIRASDKHSAWTWISFIILSAVFFASLSASGVALYLRFQQTNDKRAEQALINRQVTIVLDRQRAAIVSILCLARDVAAAQRTPSTPAQREAASEFYARALSLVHYGGCPLPSKANRHS